MWRVFIADLMLNWNDTNNPVDGLGVCMYCS